MDKFTATCASVLNHAAELAGAPRDTRVEHLALALTYVRMEEFDRICGSIHLDPLKFRDYLTMAIGVATAPPVGIVHPAINANPDQFSHLAKQAVLLASESAKSFNHDYISAEHLLLGLVQLSEKYPLEGPALSYLYEGTRLYRSERQEAILAHSLPGAALPVAPNRPESLPPFTFLPSKIGIDDRTEASEQWTPADDENALRLLVDPGSAPPEAIGEILSEISRVYRRMGGSGVTFSFESSTILEEAWR